MKWFSLSAVVYISSNISVYPFFNLHVDARTWCTFPLNQSPVSNTPFFVNSFCPPSCRRPSSFGNTPVPHYPVTSPAAHWHWFSFSRRVSSPTLVLYPALSYSARNLHSSRPIAPSFRLWDSSTVWMHPGT